MICIKICMDKAGEMSVADAKTMPDKNQKMPQKPMDGSKMPGLSEVMTMDMGKAMDKPEEESPKQY